MIIRHFLLAFHPDRFFSPLSSDDELNPCSLCRSVCGCSFLIVENFLRFSRPGHHNSIANDSKTMTKSKYNKHRSNDSLMAMPWPLVEAAPWAICGRSWWTMVGGRATAVFCWISFSNSGRETDIQPHRSHPTI